MIPPDPRPKLKPYYEHGGITIYHGDNREILPLLGKFDLCLTDPPYGIGRGFSAKGAKSFGGNSKGGKRIERKDFNDQWDSEIPTGEFLRLMISCASLSIIFGGNYFAHLLPLATHWLVWDKLNTCPTFSDCELAYTTSERKSTKKITIEYNGLLGKKDIRLHPTQKPIDLFLYCIQNYIGDGKLIIDPYLGSGTSLRAAKDLGYSGVGIEREEKYCEIAARRLQQEQLL